MMPVAGRLHFSGYRKSSRIEQNFEIAAFPVISPRHCKDDLAGVSRLSFYISKMAGVPHSAALSFMHHLPVIYSPNQAEMIVCEHAEFPPRYDPLQLPVEAEDLDRAGAQRTGIALFDGRNSVEYGAICN